MNNTEALKRKQLLDAGTDLCHVYGPDALAAEQVAKHTRISKRTLYKYFGDRDHFVAAIITHEAEQWREWFFNAVNEYQDGAAHALQALYNVLNLWVSSDEFRGLLFARATYMFPNKTPPCIQEAVREQTASLRRFIEASLRKAHGKCARQTAATLLFLVMAILADGDSRVPCDDQGHNLTMRRAALALLKKVIDQNNKAQRSPS